MQRRMIWLALAATGIALSSCSWFKKKPEAAPPKEKTAPQNRLIGRIASVSTDKTFVLIQSYGPWDIETGGILTTRGPDERVSNLRCTGEKLGQFAAADIQAGNPQPGDAVFHTAASPPSGPAETATKPTSPASP